ncbi:MAG: class I SAM-dependent methyltransferase [Dehalococcoidia bacterium]
MSPIEKFFVNSGRRQRSRVAQAKRLLAQVSLVDAREYLEIGCGAGAVARSVATDFALNATGVDIDRGQVELATRRAAGLPNLIFLEADAACLPFEDRRFDVVLSFMATHHIVDVSAALGEIRRVLKPGGYFVYSDIFLPGIVAAMGAVFGHGYHLPRSGALRSAVEHHGFAEVFASRQAPQFYGHFEAVYLLGPNPSSSGARVSDPTLR